MVCGERYKHMAVTTGGYTFDNPYGYVGTPYDYAQWRSLAEKLITTVNRHLVELQRIESERGSTFDRWIPLANERTALISDFEDLQSPYTIVSGIEVEERITEAMAVVSTALCVLDMTDQAIESYGEKPPTLPSLRPKPKPPVAGKDIPWWVWALGAGTVVAFAGGFYYGWKRR